MPSDYPNFQYPQEPAGRRFSGNHAGSDDYKMVDAAMKEPVRILNEDIGFQTHASCEGHLEDDSPINSYIAIKGVKLKDFGEFLISSGFVFKKSSSMIGKWRAKIFTTTVKVSNYFSIRLEALPLSNGIVSLNVFEEPEPLNQSEWDTIRDCGWYLWLNILSYYKDIAVQPKIMNNWACDFLYDRCVLGGPSDRISYKQLYKAYKAYCKDTWISYFPSEINFIRDVRKLAKMTPEWSHLKFGRVQRKGPYKCSTVIGMRLKDN